MEGDAEEEVGSGVEDGRIGRRTISQATEGEGDTSGWGPVKGDGRN